MNEFLKYFLVLWMILLICVFVFLFGMVVFLAHIYIYIYLFIYSVGIVFMDFPCFFFPWMIMIMNFKCLACFWVWICWKVSHSSLRRTSFFLAETETFRGLHMFAPPPTAWDPQTYRETFFQDVQINSTESSQTSKCSTSFILLLQQFTISIYIYYCFISFI